MTDTVLLGLNLANLALIGSLPRIFFRRGRLNRDWWLTAAPFFGSAGVAVAGLGGLLQPRWPVSPTQGGAATLLAGASIFLIGYTMGTHRRPLALWHQADDEPVELITEGAYARVRHPFYAAFLLALVSLCLSFPHPSTVALLVYAALRLNHTAALEEAKLLASPFGRSYSRYRGRTGRFAPSLRRLF